MAFTNKLTNKLTSRWTNASDYITSVEGGGNYLHEEIYTIYILPHSHTDLCNIKCMAKTIFTMKVVHADNMPTAKRCKSTTVKTYICLHLGLLYTIAIPISYIYVWSKLAHIYSAHGGNH